MKIYVGNLSFNVTDEDLQKEFEVFGNVVSATVIKDKFSGESKGFGFVEMPANTAAQAAITGLNGKEMKGRNINVNEARPRDNDRGGRPGGGGGRSGGGGRPGGGGNRRSW